MARRFRDQIYLIPFGRFRNERNRTSSSAASFVGREGQRAFLIEELSGAGKRGAYLITGRRGVGKTTFVEHCLKEYQTSIFRRFLRSNYGKSFFDIGLIITMFLLMITLLVSGGGFAEILVPNIKSNPITLIPLLVILYLVLLPISLAYKIIRKILINHRWGMAGFFSVIVLGGMLWYIVTLPPFGSPVQSILLMILGSAVLLNFNYVFFTNFFAPKKDKKTIPIIFYFLQLLLLLLIFSTIYIISWLYDNGILIDFIEKTILVVDNQSNFQGFSLSIKKLLISTDGISIDKGIFTGGQDIVYIFSLIFLSGVLYLVGFFNIGFYYFLSKNKNKDIYLRYLFPISLPLLLVLAYDISIFFGLAIFILLAVLACQIIRLFVLKFTGGLPSKDKIRYHAPPLETLLIFKAFFLCLIAAQIIYPFVALAPEGIVKSMQSNNGGEHFSMNRTLTMSSFERHNPEKLIKVSKENDDHKYFTLFPDELHEEGKWILLVVFLLMLLYFLEYEWINRPFIKQRENKTVDSGPRDIYSAQHPLDDYWIDSASHRDLKSNTVSVFRNFESVTFPYLFSSLWMPSIIVRINLGFNSLDHRDVIHSMLYGLRNEYKNKFVGLKSKYGLVSFLAKLVVLALLTSLVSKAYIDFPDVANDLNMAKNKSISPDGYNIDYCQILKKYSRNDSRRKEMSQFNKNLCNFSKDWAVKVIPILFSEVVKINVNESIKPKENKSKAIFLFLHFNVGLPNINNDGNFFQRESLSLRLYHLLVFIILLWILNFVLKVFPLLPYERTLRSIEVLIESLNQTKKEKRSVGYLTPSLWFRKAFSEESEYEISRDKTDPRTIELAFMSLLEEIQNSPADSALSRVLKISIPTPELHFIFDELDKITGSLNPDKNTSEFADGEQQSFRFERLRAAALHKLLSDMKRIISSSPARFIFVGGRMLHDEWMADQGRRQPLLSSIFDAEIYLPSLMLDLPSNQYSQSLNLGKARERKLTSRVREYFIRVHGSSVSLFEEVKFSRNAPFYGLKKAGFNTSNFFDDYYAEDNALTNISVVDWNYQLVRNKKIKTEGPQQEEGQQGIQEQLQEEQQGGGIQGQLQEEQQEGIEGQLQEERQEVIQEQLQNDLKKYLINDYIRFLTYRSAGSPKKMLEILSSSIRPVTRFTNSEIPYTRVSEILPCRDVLVFKEMDIYRIQFIASLFRHIEENFEEKLLARDDKISVNIIHLFDFLLKFHGRAFTWNSLEKLDELAHIHHVPDLRRLLESIVDKSSNDYLYALLNGLYSFRFRSEFVVEIRYLSRHSEQEMAAFNFTLDESQDLKATYSAMLNTSGETNEDIITSLGELHEYDQAYDLARGYYEMAIKINDKNFANYVGEKVDVSDSINQKIEEITSQKFTSINTREIATLLSNYNPPEQVPFLKAILMQDKEGIKNSTYFVPWIIRRIRLMLQIGMTFEQAKDLERAQTYYHASNIFVRSLFDFAFSSSQENDSESNENKALVIQLIKQMNVLFQPVFAEAWISEKLEGSIDTSLSLIENYLFDLRKNLPFLKDFYATKESKVSDTITNSNFALVGVEMHNKAGDLYFFKGKEGVLFSSGEDFLKEIFDASTELVINNGYLYKSHYHYAMSLHELRRYIVYRMETSQVRFGIFDKKTQSSDFLPSFVNSAISNSLIDFSQNSIARTSFFTVLKTIKSNKNSFLSKFNKEANEKKTHESFRKILSLWFNSPDTSFDKIYQDLKDDENILSNDILVQLIPKYIKYFGRWNISKEIECIHKAKANKKNKISNPKFLNFIDFDNEAEQLIFSLYSAALGAEYSTYLGQNNRSSAGYRMVLIFVNSYLKSYRIIRLLELGLFSKYPSQEDFEFNDFGVYEFLYKIMSIASFSVEKCDNLRKQMIPNNKKYKVGSVIPVELASATCELQLNIYQCISDLEKLQAIRKSTLFNIDKLLESFESLAGKVEDISCDWYAGNDEAVSTYINGFDIYQSNIQKSNTVARSRLIYIQTRHRFPVLASLSTLKSIVDEQMSEVIHSTYESICDKYLLLRFFESLDWLEEMCELANALNAPQHFTPVMQAESLALASLAIHTIMSFDELFGINLSSICKDNEEVTKMNNSKVRMQSDLKDKFCKLAHVQLREAEESFTQGAKYYKSISDLYYLFDDFNDRQLHANHALQMGKSDTIAILKAYLQAIE